MPFAVDTNVLLRMLIDDSSAQCRSASERLRRDRIFVSSAVMVECEWVLRSNLGLKPQEISSLFQLLGGNGSVEFDDIETVCWSIDALRNGFDFADAVHLHAARRCDAFLTFDRDLIKKASRHVDFLKVESP